MEGGMAGVLRGIGGPATLLLLLLRTNSNVAQGALMGLLLMLAAE